MIDIALVLDDLVPEGNWQGSVTDNTKESFDNLRWNDNRPKPTWEEVEDRWLITKASWETKEEQEQKIHNEIRQIAIKNLKNIGELPINYED